MHQVIDRERADDGDMERQDGEEYHEEGHECIDQG
jgi:hypothetical protein